MKEIIRIYKADPVFWSVLLFILTISGFCLVAFSARDLFFQLNRIHTLYLDTFFQNYTLLGDAADFVKQNFWPELVPNLQSAIPMIVTTPEKWDAITRKSSDMSLSMVIKLLIIDEVHLLNDDKGPVIEALVARTLRQVTHMSYFLFFFLYKFR